MRALLAVVLAGTLAVAACGKDDDLLPDGPVLVGIGDSYVAGVELSSSGLTRVGEAWIDTVAAQAGLAKVNLGRAGSLSRDAARVARRVHPGADDVVVVGTGTNDMRTYGADPARLADFGTRLRSLLADLDGAGCVIVLPVLPVVLYALYPPANRGSQQAVVAYEKVAAEVTAGTGAVLADVASRWDPTTMLAADGAHPNQLGETTIAESVLRGVAACRPA